MAGTGITRGYLGRALRATVSAGAIAAHMGGAEAQTLGYQSGISGDDPRIILAQSRPGGSLLDRYIGRESSPIPIQCYF